MGPCEAGDWKEDRQFAGRDEGACTECIAQIAKDAEAGEIIL